MNLQLFCWSLDNALYKCPQYLKLNMYLLTIEGLQKTYIIVSLYCGISGKSVKQLFFGGAVGPLLSGQAAEVITEDSSDSLEGMLSNHVIGCVREQSVAHEGALLAKAHLRK